MTLSTASTAAQAMNFCLRKGLTVLYLDDVRIGIANHETSTATHHTADIAGLGAREPKFDRTGND